MAPPPRPQARRRRSGPPVPQRSVASASRLLGAVMPRSHCDEAAALRWSPDTEDGYHGYSEEPNPNEEPGARKWHDLSRSKSSVAAGLCAAHEPGAVRLPPRGAEIVEGGLSFGRLVRNPEDFARLARGVLAIDHGRIQGGVLGLQLALLFLQRVQPRIERRDLPIEVRDTPPRASQRRFRGAQFPVQPHHRPCQQDDDEACGNERDDHAPEFASM